MNNLTKELGDAPNPSVDLPDVSALFAADAFTFEPVILTSENMQTEEAGVCFEIPLKVRPNEVEGYRLDFRPVYAAIADLAPHVAITLGADQYRSFFKEGVFDIDDATTGIPMYVGYRHDQGPANSRVCLRVGNKNPLTPDQVGQVVPRLQELFNYLSQAAQPSP